MCSESWWLEWRVKPRYEVLVIRGSIYLVRWDTPGLTARFEFHSTFGRHDPVSQSRAYASELMLDAALRALPPDNRHVIFPLVWLLAAAAGPTAGMFGIDGWAAIRKRRRSGRCVKCGYDLSGLAEGVVCPECGAGKSQGRSNTV